MESVAAEVEAEKPSMDAEPAPAEPASVEPAAGEVPKFEFDAAFQTRIAAFAVRDDAFMRRAAHLLHPDHFENIGEATLVSIALKYYKRFGSIPDNPLLLAFIKDEVKAGAIRKDVLPLLVEAIKRVRADTLVGREYVEEKVATFVRHQAVGNAILKSVDLREKGQFGKIEALIKEAASVGLNDDGDAYDYFARNDERMEERTDRVSGKRPPTGITTGIPQMDDLLYHRGWGRKELATIMGTAKSGKTTALVEFAKSASFRRHNVLYVTLEVTARIVAERLDANISDTLIRALEANIHRVRERIANAEKRAGKLVIHEFPSGAFKPSMLRRLIEIYLHRGVRFDLVVVDYADIMAPDYRTDSTIENSKSIYVTLRGIAAEFNLALLTATQTNREGHRATVARIDHISEDFNKARIADLIISINRTEEEVLRNEARLYFAASRNQESGFSIRIKQDLAKMKFVTMVLGTE
jgi:replicative DNA helicase